MSKRKENPALNQNKNYKNKISNFIASILEKNYSQADKYLTSTLDSKMKARIEKELNTPLF